MLRRTLLVLAAAAAAALLVAGSASAGRRSVSRASLALMPLAKPALGKDAFALPLDQDSGVQTNADAARDATAHVTAAQLTRLGRLTGYELDYNDAAGHALAARKGLLEVSTGVELYGTPAAARSGLAFWRDDARKLLRMSSVGIGVSMHAFRATGLPGPTYATTARVTVKGKPPVYGTVVGFTSGPLVAAVSISAADSRDRRAYALGLARRLRTRIEGVLAGRITGPPVPLPGKAKAGPPPHGPELSRLTLSPSDLGGGTVKQQGYRLDKDLSPISEYQRTLSPAGPFLYLQEQVALFHSATEAGFTFSVLASTLSSPSGMSAFGATGVTTYQPTKVTVHGGDEARAVRAKVALRGGTAINEALVVIRTGAATEFLVVGSPGSVQIPIAAIQRLARTAAARALAALRK